MTGRPAGVSQKAWTFLKAEGMTQGLAADVLCTLMEKSGEEWRRMEKSCCTIFGVQCSVYGATHMYWYSEMTSFTVYAAS